VELAHETLLQHWPRLRAWCQRCGSHLSQRRQAEQAAQDWQKSREKELDAAAAARSHLLRWGWERQKPALEALLLLGHEAAPHDAEFRDAGIAAWRALESHLDEPLRGFLEPEPLLLLLAELAGDETTHQRREEIGLRLNQMGDPRRGVGLDDHGIPDIAWVDILEGEVTLETGQTIPVPPFRIARYPVTWSQYRAFRDAEDGYRDPRWWDGRDRDNEPGALRWAFANYPAVNVSWCDAVAFCRWLTAKLGLGRDAAVRLPTEWEWQWVAGAGAERREYPWGSKWLANRANSDASGIGRTVAVGLYPLGAPKPWPVLDLAGNVWEWCLNQYDHPEKTQLSGEGTRVLRGGSWNYDPGFCRAAHRGDRAPGHRFLIIGFRVCCGAPIE
jgi:hypothetical protein